ncbi:MAG: hypothetical protein HZB56_10555 [Deltaproteobacteria bacterium]|nr:hypothetical protein [Deltaproteobacteria bacterium]
MKKALALALLLAAPAAQAESPRWGSFHFKLGSYRPNIDAEFEGKAGCTGGADCTPYADLFGKGGSMLYQVEFARTLLSGAGTLDLGFGVGWSSKSAKGFIEGGTTRSSDDTSFRVLPLTLSLTYRLDLYARTVPLVPYARLALERYQWWATSGGGGTASANGLSGSGATNGWSGALGLAFLLDFLDPTLAREMDRDIGINGTYLFVEAGKAKVNDFGSRKSWDLSPDKSVTWSGGLLFVF